MLQVSEGVYRLGRRRHNFYLLLEGGRATVVDAGGARELGMLQAALGRLRLGLGAVEAILLTHAHSDHLGFAAEASTRGVPVRAHEAEADYARYRIGDRQVRPTDLPVWKPRVWLFFAEMLRAGAVRHIGVPALETVADGETLDLPGRPTVVHTPGHTRGHACYVSADRGILFAGDAVATMSFLHGGEGPRLLEDLFHTDPARARRSLGLLRGLGTDLLLPGHGDPWHGPIDEVVDAALAR